MTAPTWTEADSTALTVALVAQDGHRMPLRGAERAEAIRAMAAAGLPREVMADRLCISILNVERAAKYYGARLPSIVDPHVWAWHCARPSSSPRYRRAKAVAS